MSGIRQNQVAAGAAKAFRWTLLKRALLYKRAKAVLILLAVALGCSVITALVNLESDLRYRMNRELRDYGPNVYLLPAADEKYLKPEVFKRLQHEFSTARITAATSQTFAPVKINKVGTTLVAADLTALQRLYPGWRWKKTTQPLDQQLFLGKRLARKLQTDVGKPVLIEFNGEQHPFNVAGIIEGGEAEDDRIFCELSAFRKISSASSGPNMIAISALGTIPGVQEYFSNFVKRHPGVRFQLVRKIAMAESAILDKISRLMGIVISIIIVILFFCINTTVSAVLIAREREIALLRVLGANRTQIMTGLTLELLVLAVAGGVLGFGLGVVMAQMLGKLLFQTYVVPSWQVFLITILSSVALMVISSISPIRRAINRQAAIVLKEV